MANEVRMKNDSLIRATSVIRATSTVRLWHRGVRSKTGMSIVEYQ
jgi:hypothetical protein